MTARPNTYLAKQMRGTEAGRRTAENRTNEAVERERRCRLPWTPLLGDRGEVKIVGGYPSYVPEDR